MSPSTWFSQVSWSCTLPPMVPSAVLSAAPASKDVAPAATLMLEVIGSMNETVSEVAPAVPRPVSCCSTSCCRPVSLPFSVFRYVASIWVTPDAIVFSPESVGGAGCPRRRAAGDRRPLHGEVVVRRPVVGGHVVVRAAVPGQQGVHRGDVVVPAVLDGGVLRLRGTGPAGPQRIDDVLEFAEDALDGGVGVGERLPDVADGAVVDVDLAVTD